MKILSKILLHWVGILAMLLFPSQSYAEKGLQEEKMKLSRLRRVELCHLEFGVECGGYVNYFVAPKLSIGLGSEFTRFSVRAGLGYRLINPWAGRAKENIQVDHVPFHLSLNIHPYRFEGGYVYAGVEALYNVSCGGRHVVPAYQGVSKDSRLPQNCMSGRVALGLKKNRIITSLFFEYDFQPGFDQKYIYESRDYYYPDLKKSIFERYRLGVSVSYIFQL